MGKQSKSSKSGGGSALIKVANKPSTDGLGMPQARFYTNPNKFSLLPSPKVEG